MAGDKGDDAFWQEVYNARQKYFESTVGPLPQDILKMMDMFGIWPGGGLFVIPADKIGKGLCVYTTFGFTNPDMPTHVRATNVKVESDGKRATGATGTLEKKEPAPKRPGAAGYGYEIIVIAQKDQQWPLGFLQWAVHAEIRNDAGLLDLVEKYDGITVEQIDVGAGESINVLIAKAQAPLPTGTQLPNGKMDILVATTITEEEMRWSMENGQGALLQKLQHAGVGQVSILKRKSVVQ